MGGEPSGRKGRGTVSNEWSEAPQNKRRPLVSPETHFQLHLRMVPGRFETHEGLALISPGFIEKVPNFAPSNSRVVRAV